MILGPVPHTVAGIILGLSAITGANAQTTPTIDSIVNGASFKPEIGSGGFITIFGKNLSGCTKIAYDLPTQVTCDDPAKPGTTQSVQVLYNGNPAKLSYVSGSQINTIGPSINGAHGAIDVIVNNNKNTSKPYTISVNDIAIGIFQNYHVAASIRPDGTPLWFNALLNPGDYASVFATGGGAVTSTDTVQAGATPVIINHTAPPDLAIGGQQIRGGIIFAGLAPCCQALWQYNVQTPKDVTPSSAQTISFTFPNGSTDSADILIGPGVGGHIEPTNSSLTATRPTPTISGSVTANSTTSTITGYGNFVVAPTNGTVHVSVDGKGRYVNLEHDTTTTELVTNPINKLPELVVDSDAKYTFLNNHQEKPSDYNNIAALFWQAGTQGMNNRDFALYSNTLYAQFLTSVNPGGWNAWTYDKLILTLWSSLPVQVANIEGAPAGQAVLNGVKTDLKAGLRAIINAQTINGIQAFTEVKQCDPNKPCIDITYKPIPEDKTYGEAAISVNSDSTIRHVTVILPDATEPIWLNIAHHEFGHSLGLIFHSPSATHIMYQYLMSAPTTSLTPLEQSTLDFLYMLRDNKQTFNVAETKLPADMSKALQVNTTGVVGSSSTTAHYLQAQPLLNSASVQCGGVRILPFEGSVNDVHQTR